MLKQKTSSLLANATTPERACPNCQTFPAFSQFLTMVIRRLRAISFHLFPGNCLLCHQRSVQPKELCHRCEQDLPVNGPCCTQCAIPLYTPGLCGTCLATSPAFDQCIAPLRYEFPVNKLIHHFKYQGQLCNGIPLADILLAHIQSSYGQRPVDLILPVPLHWQRQCLRGFNQSQWLANYLAQQLEIPVIHQCLTRKRKTTSQQGLNRQQRKKNLRGAFQLKAPLTKKYLSGKTIALVDDVVTTGSTALEISGLLKKAGAARVEIWCLARTPLEK